MELKVYTRRFGGKVDHYKLSKTATGWYFDFDIKGDCDSFGRPLLYEALDRDYINYPADLSGYLDYLWRMAEENNYDEATLQKHLDTLGDWITTVERSTPTGLLGQYK